jgi:hypothetical protein
VKGDLGQLTAVSRLQSTLHLNLVSSRSLPDAGAHSLDAVARAINAAGITPPEGRAWYKTTVEAYLRHEGDELEGAGHARAFAIRGPAEELKLERRLARGGVGPHLARLVQSNQRVQ